MEESRRQGRLRGAIEIHTGNGQRGNRGREHPQAKPTWGDVITFVLVAIVVCVVACELVIWAAMKN